MTQQPWPGTTPQPAADVDPLEGGEKSPAVSFKDVTIGTVITMEVTAAAKLLQSRNFETQELDFWKEKDGTRGNPKMAVVINGLVEGEPRSFWATKPSDMFAALQAAQKEAGCRIGVGGTLEMALVGETAQTDPKRLRQSPSKNYRARYSPVDALATAPPAQPAPPVLPYGGSPTGPAQGDPFTKPADGAGDPPF